MLYIVLNRQLGKGNALPGADLLVDSASGQPVRGVDDGSRYP